MAALLDVRNANAAGIPFGICQRGITAFSELGKPSDIGRAEIQGMYLPFLFSLRFNHSLEALSFSACH
jgi:hypothetical protein